MENKGDLHKKVFLLEDVGVHLYSSDVSYDLENETTDHTDKESPCFPADRKSDLGGKQDDEDAQVQSISCQRRYVIQVALIPGSGRADGIVTLILLAL